MSKIKFHLDSTVTVGTETANVSKEVMFGCLHCDNEKTTLSFERQQEGQSIKTSIMQRHGEADKIVIQTKGDFGYFILLKNHQTTEGYLKYQQRRVLINIFTKNIKGNLAHLESGLKIEYQLLTEGNELGQYQITITKR